MTLAEYLERWGRALFEAPFSQGQANEPPELAEIRFAILDQVREKSYRSGGKKVFPFNIVRLHLRGVEDSRAPVFTGKFFRNYFEQELRRHLDKSECRYPDDLSMEVQVLRELPTPSQPWLWVEVESRERPPAAPPPVARLVVVEGQPNRAEVPLDKPRINIGRVVDVYRSAGLHRRNDLAFIEDTEINRTVSREHAHIIYDPSTREYRLFNDRWYKRDEPGVPACGIWIVRDGLSQEVHRTTRGAKLEPGDEIHFGKAVVFFQLS